MTEKEIKIICVTPVKNESWILDKFLTATSLWADHIIIADQKSTDNSVEIAKKYNKATVIKNDTDYNEFERTKLLMQEVRKIPGKKIVFALDADEFFTANIFESPEWQTILDAAPGTVLLFDRVNLTPDFSQHFGSLKMVLGFVDDGITTIDETSKAIIHNIRLPYPKGARSIYFKDIKAMHYDYVIPERTLSKLVWYQCFERIKFKHSDLYLLNKYRTFNHISEFLAKQNLQSVPEKWFSGFAQKNVDMTSLNSPILWWDDEVLKMMETHGIGLFVNLDLQIRDWAKLAKEKGYAQPDNFILRRSLVNKLKLRYLKSKL